MKIENRTLYPTAPIRSLICAAHRYASERVGPLRQWSCLTVKVYYPRGNERRRGWAYYNETTMGLALSRFREVLPDGRRVGGRVDVRELTKTILHEFWHLRGLRHKDMPGYPSNGEIAWCEKFAESNFYIYEKRPAKVSRSERAEARRQERLARAQTAVVEWTRRAKFAQTKLKTWKARLRRIERALPVAAAPEVTS